MVHEKRERLMYPFCYILIAGILRDSFFRSHQQHQTKGPECTTQGIECCQHFRKFT